MAASHRLPCYAQLPVSLTITLAISTLESLIVAVPRHCKWVKFLQYFALSKIIAFTALLLALLMHSENRGVVIHFPAPLGWQKHQQIFKDPQKNLEFLT